MRTDLSPEAAVDQTTIEGRWHPGWCEPRCCTAYQEDVEPALHRSAPAIVPRDDDPAISYYLFLESDDDGGDPHLHLVGLEQPHPAQWWQPDHPYDELLLPLGAAVKMFDGLGGLLAQASGSRF